jgi:hypothetical protein
MLIENDDDFHRVQLSVNVSENQSPAHLIVGGLWTAIRFRLIRCQWVS